MNEFYEAVSNLFEELRCDSGEREYTVQPEEWKEAEKNLKQIQKKLPLHLEKIPEREQNFWNKYLDQLEHFHYEEEQRAYYQGMMDVVEFLINIGAIKKSTNVKRMIEKYASLRVAVWETIPLLQNNSDRIQMNFRDLVYRGL
ncbi:MAG: hypothetical protein ACLTTJ_06905 [Blautia sp.]